MAAFRSVADITINFSHVRNGCPSPWHTGQSNFFTAAFAELDELDVNATVELDIEFDAEWYALTRFLID